MQRQHRTVCGSEKEIEPAINTSDNRLSSGQGYSFDAAGSTTRDAGDRKFTYS